MFKPASVSETFVLPVTAPIPDEKGRKVNANFTLICKRLPREEVLGIWKAVQPVLPKLAALEVATAAPTEADSAAEPPAEAETPRKQMTDDEVIDRVVVGFGRDIVDENNTPLEWSAANKALVFAVHPVTECAVAAFFDYYMKAGRKN